MKDIILAIVFFLYPFLLLQISKMLEKGGMGKDATRKFVHSGMGIVVLYVPFFDNIWMALFPPILFTIVNAIDYRFGILSQIQGEDKGNIGTVLYPISYIILTAVLFHTNFWGLAVLGILAMAFGDAAASLIGRSYGKMTFIVNGENRSVAGCAAMFVVTFIVGVLVFAYYGPSMGLPMKFFSIIAASIIVAGAATLIEALSFKGTDNITVPVLTAVTAFVLINQFMPNVLGNEAIVNQPLY